MQRKCSMHTIIKEVVGVTRTAREAAHCKASASLSLSSSSSKVPPSTSSASSGRNASPLLNSAYLARSQVMHRAVECSLQVLSSPSVSSSSSSYCQQTYTLSEDEEGGGIKEKESKEMVQLVLLGAGLDTSYDSWGGIHTAATDTGADTNASVKVNMQVQVFVVDFPSVIEERLQSMATQSQQQVSSNKTISVATDLRKGGAVVWSELQAVGFQPCWNTVIVTEMVMNYLPVEILLSLVTELDALRKQQSQSMLLLNQKQIPEYLWISYDFYSLFDSSLKSESKSCEMSFVKEMFKHYAAKGAPLVQVQASNYLQSARKTEYRSSANVVATHFCQLWPCAFVRAVQAWLVAVVPGKLCTDNKRDLRQGQGQKEQGGQVEEVLFDEYASLALLHRHFGISLYGSSPTSFIRVLSSLGVLCVPVSTKTSTSMNKKVQEQQTRVQWSQAASLYQQSFSSHAARHRSVAKYISAAGKQLKESNSFRAVFVCIASNISETPTALHFCQLPFQGHSDKKVVGLVALQITDVSVDNQLKVEDNESMHMNTLFGRAEVSHMCVDSAYHRQGIGQQLLGNLLIYVREYRPNVARIELSVMTDLSAAVALYLRNGFCALGGPVDNGSCKLQRMVLNLCSSE